jgi:hypothetical protein
MLIQMPDIEEYIGQKKSRFNLLQPIFLAEVKKAEKDPKNKTIIRKTPHQDKGWKPKVQSSAPESPQ